MRKAGNERDSLRIRNEPEPTQAHVIGVTTAPATNRSRLMSIAQSATRARDDQALTRADTSFSEWPA